ncbi:ABC transporter ATP-binding protein [Haloimpatiens lingqiaonensis]|uniref:ABC transporter ATP-binding protein n=1 Tax=Haloimpatiens lingqiaonensis TaxID=1380675 RepID=UPI0010FF4649|nr:ABC transporter ATP-binding protein [Haloimpatiens lingqiaonensis]
MYLELKNLSKTFSNIKAVDNLNLEVKKGELISLLGPSGCGKTTTLKMIGGFLEPNSGNIILENEDITHLEPYMRPVSTVFQNYALFPHMTVIQNVIYGLKFRKIKKKEAISMGREILETVGLKEFENQNVTRLSGGQQQRVALARALILNPKVLLLDEPLSNLDAKLRIKMREEIKDIQLKFNITMIFVTHDQEEALSISDRIVVMNNGNIEQIGTPEEIYKNPSSEFVADFIGRANIVKRSDGNYRVIRPEQINLIKYNENSENNILLGSIIQKHFKGAFTTYFVQIEDQIMEADVVNNLGEEFSIGQKVCVKFN